MFKVLNNIRWNIKINFTCFFLVLKMWLLALIGVAQLVGVSPIYQKVGGSITIRGTYLGCRFDPQLGSV